MTLTKEDRIEIYWSSVKKKVEVQHIEPIIYLFLSRENSICFAKSNLDQNLCKYEFFLYLKQNCNSSANVSFNRKRIDLSKS